ncbi:chromosomal passenger protein [Angomonas deanei]|nr:chromosomal passenger protein [Angomonas deanei]EPY33171.1 chromosomal passenger protein [Angomonas deanei]|eukprot:EPY30653.1 chromosomal passenger protein [Angomonas deanei]
MDTQVWTPQLVEELMFREFIKKEDVSSLLPPAPSCETASYVDRYEQTTKILYAYIRNGPLTALTSQNVNSSLANKHYNFTPSKATSRAVPPKTVEVQRTQRTPTPKPPSRTASLHKNDTPQSSQPYPRNKRQRVEWPSDVPQNDKLKSNSRSKVAPFTAIRCAAQEGVDPDFLFVQNPGELPLERIFSSYKNALRSVQSVRNASGNWTEDTFSTYEENLYKTEMGYDKNGLGPSQCQMKPN